MFLEVESMWLFGLELQYFTTEVHANGAVLTNDTARELSGLIRSLEEEAA
jgi:hypothetical protein